MRKPKARPLPKAAVQPLAETGRPAGLAKFVLRPTVQAAMTVREFNLGTVSESSLPFNGLLDELTTQCKLVNAGKQDRPEEILTAQAHTLDAIFNTLARKAAISQHMPTVEAYLRLALKAQSQCRTTLEALAEMKSPRPVAFIAQANVAGGQQQVVNNVDSRAGKTEIWPSEQSRLGHEDGERLDFATPGATSAADPRMETLGTVDRTAYRCREGQVIAKRLEGRNEADAPLPGESAA